MTREEAIMVLKNEQPHCGKKALFPEEKKYEAYDVAIKALEHEPKTGHWIDTDEGFSPCECSECKLVEFKKSKYCPNCGARMVGDEE